MLRWTSGVLASLLVCAGPSLAHELWLTPELPELRLAINGQEVVISREGEGLSCPPMCVQPIRMAPGVVSFGALEVIGFLANDLARREGLVLDVRLPDAYGRGHVPGAVNVPEPTLSGENPLQRDILLALGVREAEGALEFSRAPVLVIYGQDAMDGRAIEALRHVMSAGYPAEKLRYFRGGFQEWQLFGLTEGSVKAPG